MIKREPADLSRSKRVLVVEDEEDTRKMIAMSLADFQVIEAKDGAEGLRLARQSAPELIILDIMLPEMNGLEICRQLKADRQTCEVPVILLTAKATEIDRVVGLEMGAEDYVTKPFSPRELALRVKAHLRARMHKPGPQQTLSAGDIHIDLSAHLVRVKEKPVTLTPIEFKMLTLLIERHPRVVSREALLQKVWGEDTSVLLRTIDVNIRRLRKKLGKAGELIGTTRGFGYRINTGQKH